MGNLGDNQRPSSVAPVKIGAAGLDARTRNAIELFLKVRFSAQYVLVEPEEADFWMIDLDSVNGRDLWVAHTKEYPGVPPILLSIHEKQEENAYCVRKPMSMAAAVAVLEQVTKGRTAKEVDTSRDRSSQEVVSTPAVSAAAVTGRSPMDRELSAQSGLAPPAGSGHHVREKALEVHTTESIGTIQTAVAAGGAISQRPSVDDAQFSRRPRVPASFQAATRLDERQTHMFIGSAPDIDPDDPHQVASAQFDPDRFLVGLVSRATAQAMRTGQQLRVSGREGVIVVQPEAEQFVVDIKSSLLRSLAAVPLSQEMSIQPLNGAETMEGTIWPFDRFQWMLTLWAARGRVPVGTDLRTPVRLTHWPNLTRLELFPNAMRIASLWSQQATSLLDTATALNIPQRYVFAFFSAAHGLGMVEILSKASGAIVDASTADLAIVGSTREHQSSKPGLLRRILAHLRLG